MKEIRRNAFCYFLEGEGAKTWLLFSGKKLNSIHQAFPKLDCLEFTIGGAIAW